MWPLSGQAKVLILLHALSGQMSAVQLEILTISEICLFSEKCGFENGIYVFFFNHLVNFVIIPVHRVFVKN